MSPFNLLTVKMIILSSILYCCSSRPVGPITTPQDDIRVRTAQRIFDQGDWEALKIQIRDLPDTGELGQYHMFFTAVLKGLVNPTEGIQLLRTLERQWPRGLEEKIPLYIHLFQANAGKCLLAEGPLRKLYVPKQQTLSLATRALLQHALTQCDAQKVTQAQQPQIAPVGHALIPPLTQIPIDDNDSPTDQLSLQEKLEIQLKKQRPQIALILPKDKTKPLRARDDLKELPKVMMEEKVSQGSALRIKTFEPIGSTELQEQITHLSQEFSVVVAFIYTEQQYEIIVNSYTKDKGPLFLLSTLSHAPTNTDAQIWQININRDLVAQELCKIARSKDGQRAFALSIPGPKGSLILQTLKSKWTEFGGDWTGAVQLATDPDSTYFTQVAQKIKDSNADTLLFATHPLHAAQISQYLAQINVWSSDVSEAKQAHSQSVHYMLWPSVYVNSIFQTAGRYLEGAILVNNFVRESEEYQAFDQLLRATINRTPRRHDVLLYGLLDQLDHAIRYANVKQMTVKEALNHKYQKQSSLLPPLDLSNNTPLQSLYTLTIKGHDFISIDPDHTTTKDDRSTILEE